MTPDQAKREQKESEGDPHLKARIRSAQRDLARKRMMAAVPKADVVITNPTHFAVALKYMEARHRAPVVVARAPTWWPKKSGSWRARTVCRSSRRRHWRARFTNTSRSAANSGHVVRRGGAGAGVRVPAATFCARRRHTAKRAA